MNRTSTASNPVLPISPPHLGRWYALFALPLLAIMVFVFWRPIQVLPRIALGPGFALVDQDGARLTNEDLRGHLVLYNFTYTGCQAPCPQTSLVMQALQARLEQLDLQGLPVTLITIAFDPTRDTPEQLRAYAQRFAAKPDTWRFVSGTETQLKNVIGGGFGVYYQPDTRGDFTFEPMFVLVDGTGIVRARYRTATPELAIIERDLGLIATEARNSTGAARFAYEAAHLFLCYPA